MAESAKIELFVKVRV